MNEDRIWMNQAKLPLIIRCSVIAGIAIGGFTSAFAGYMMSLYLGSGASCGV